MTKTELRKLNCKAGIGIFMAAFLAAPAAFAQQSESVAAYRDWTVFNPSNPKECYIVSPPITSKALKDGQPADVRRGEIRLFVTIRPEAGVNKEVSFTGGYPFRAGSEVKMTIGNGTYTLNVGEGDADEWAWPSSPEEDARVVAGMRRGATAEIEAVSARGTTTIDSFSLFGFTAALEQAEALCK